MLSQFIPDKLKLLPRLACNGHDIHIDWDDYAHIISPVHPDAVVTAHQIKVNSLEHSVQLLVPLPASLLQAIDGLDQLEHKARTKVVLKAFRLLHVDIMVHLTIEEGSGDVQAVKFQVFKCCNC